MPCHFGIVKLLKIKALSLLTAHEKWHSMPSCIDIYRRSRNQSLIQKNTRSGSSWPAGGASRQRSSRGSVHCNLRCQLLSWSHQSQYSWPRNDWAFLQFSRNGIKPLQSRNAALPGNCSVRWLPPYSPFLNIVENCFSQWKSAKKDLATTREHILQMPLDERIQTLA